MFVRISQGQLGVSLHWDLQLCHEGKRGSTDQSLVSGDQQQDLRGQHEAVQGGIK